MNDKIKMLFLDNPEMTEQIEAFCQRDPLFSKVKLEFYETAHEIAQIVGYELYDRFEQRFGLYTARSSDLYYLFGLGLRQEVVSALQPNLP